MVVHLVKLMTVTMVIVIFSSPSPCPIVVIRFEFSEYTVLEGDDLSVCLTVTDGVIAPGVMVSVMMVASVVQGNWGERFFSLNNFGAILVHSI